MPTQQILAQALAGGADFRALIRRPDGSPARVLACAAAAEVRDRVQRILAAAGCAVELASSAETGLAAAARDPPDVLIGDADLCRPAASLIERLRAEAPGKWIPAIAIGRALDAAAERETLAGGADDYLTWPFGGRQLLSRVGLALAMAQVGHDASEAVRASEQRLAEVLHTIGEAVFELDPAFHIVFANRKALEFWEKPAEAVIGRHLLEVFPGIETGEPYGHYARVMSSREPCHLELRAPMIGNRWIGLDANPAPNGNIVVAFRDIDNRKEAEAQLREGEERFRLMLEALPDIAFVIGPDGTAEYYNERLRLYAGHPIGPRPADRSALHPPEDRERLDAARAHGFAAGEDFVVEARLRRHDGVYRWHRIRNRPVRIDGRLVFWLGTAVDIDDMREANERLEQRVAERTAELEAANLRLEAQIDEREKAETRLRQAQRIEAVGQLTSGVAHDFNNLLTAIIGNLELLQTQLNPENTRALRLLNSAASAAERGARLTGQLLAFSRQQQMRPEPVDLNLVVNSMSGLLQSTIGATVRIEAVLSATLWPALADASQIELVLLNLAINARDAMAEGGAILIETANVTLGRPERPEEPTAGDYVMVSVTDSGTGIPPNILDKVFDPFFTTKAIGKGSGLGLSQVLGVAQQLGGGVRIDTRPGEGTAMRVYLPRAHGAVVLGRRPRSREGRVASRGNGTILLVDDDADVRAVSAAMMVDAGYEVLEAETGYAGLDLLERNGARVRLLVADVVMPGMSGVEMAEAARGMRPDLPVLFVTGFAAVALPPDSTFAHQLIRKPFHAAELLAKIAEMVDSEEPSKVVRLPNASKGSPL
ncbi:MAG: response regulator [Alphaproteobacteria bacterium]|nr:response regulator [Alphaproteobacteria bacterium]